LSANLHISARFGLAGVLQFLALATNFVGVSVDITRSFAYNDIDFRIKAVGSGSKLPLMPHPALLSSHSRKNSLLYKSRRNPIEREVD
jgi:hypothetical protein